MKRVVFSLFFIFMFGCGKNGSKNQESELDAKKTVPKTSFTKQFRKGKTCFLVSGKDDTNRGEGKLVKHKGKWRCKKGKKTYKPFAVYVKLNGQRIRKVIR